MDFDLYNYLENSINEVYSVNDKYVPKFTLKYDEGEVRLVKLHLIYDVIKNKPSSDNLVFVFIAEEFTYIDLLNVFEHLPKINNSCFDKLIDKIHEYRKIKINKYLNLDIKKNV